MLIFGTTGIRYLRSDTADNWYWYPFSDHINNAISIAGFVDLVISRRPEVWLSCSSNSNTATVTRTHTGQHAVHWQTIISRMVILMPPERPEKMCCHHWWSLV